MSCAWVSRMKIVNFRELETYQLAVSYQQRVFELSKLFPSEERYSLTDQWRRSSRSVGANMAEAWAKRKYVAHFTSKLTDADGELQESMHWRATAFSCGYIDSMINESLTADESAIGQKIGRMIQSADSFCHRE